MRPKTRLSGIFSTKRSRPVSTSMLTRMLVPKPKKAFQSPGVHKAGWPREAAVSVMAMLVSPLWSGCQSAAVTASVVVTEPKMPPWAAIIFRPTAWNSSK